MNFAVASSQEPIDYASSSKLELLLLITIIVSLIVLFSGENKNMLAVLAVSVLAIVYIVYQNIKLIKRD